MDKYEAKKMNIENYIESRYRELLSTDAINAEFADLYLGIDHTKLREIFTTLHHDFISLFKIMNERLPTNDYEAHFWADPSRDLIRDRGTGWLSQSRNALLGR